MKADEMAKAKAAMAKGTVSAVFVAATTSAPTQEIADSVAGSIDRGGGAAAAQRQLEA